MAKTQVAPARNIVAFKQVMERLGFHIGESLPYDPPNKGAHVPDSWHYRSVVIYGYRHSLAVDINWQGSGEPAKLRYAMKIARSMGLACIYMAPDHYSHLHADVGEWGRYNSLNWYRNQPKPKALATWDLQAVVRDPKTNLWDKDLDKRINAVKAASKYGGTKFPYGIKYTQEVIGAKPDGVWGPKSKARHDITVKNLETVLRRYGFLYTEPDTRWTLATSQAVSRARSAATKA